MKEKAITPIKQRFVVFALLTLEKVIGLEATIARSTLKTVIVHTDERRENNVKNSLAEKTTGLKT